jgi:hypothetical protein
MNVLLYGSGLFVSCLYHLGSLLHHVVLRLRVDDTTGVLPVHKIVFTPPEEVIG